MDDQTIAMRDMHAGFLHACSLMKLGPGETLATKFKSCNDMTLNAMLAMYKASLQDFATWYPEKFRYQNGSLVGFKGEETAHIREHMALETNKKGGRGGGRGAARAGRGRGGFSNTAPSFRGGRGGGFSGGFNRGAANNSSGGFDASSGRGGGYGSGAGTGGGGGFGSGAGTGGGGGFGSGTGGGGGYGSSTRDRDDYGSNSNRNRDDDRHSTHSRSTTSDNRGFASNFDTFDERSGRDNDRYSRSGSNNYDDNRSSSNYGDRFGGRDYDRDSFERHDKYTVEDYDRREALRSRDMEELSNNYQNRYTKREINDRREHLYREHLQDQIPRERAANEGRYENRDRAEAERRHEHYYDDRREYDDRRGRDIDNRRQSNDDDDEDDYYNDEDDGHPQYRARSRSRGASPTRGGGRQEYGSNGQDYGNGHRRYNAEDDDRRGSSSNNGNYVRRDRSPARRREHSYDSNDDGYRNGQENGRGREERGATRNEENQPRRAFPSAMGGGGGGGSDRGGGYHSGPNDRDERASAYSRAAASVFDPVEITDERERSYGRETGRGSDKSTPEDPRNAKQACLPTSNTVSPPPGFEDVLCSLQRPPGLVYPTGPPPGLTRLVQTPTQREGEIDAKQVRIEEVAQLIFDALFAEGGTPIPADRVLGAVLQHCQRDLTAVVKTQGGIFHVLDKIARRSNDRMEFVTNDKDQDEICLVGVHKDDAIRRARENPRAASPMRDLGIPDIEPEDSASQVSYQSANTSFRPPPSTAATSGPVASEVKLANDLWLFARDRGTYSSTKAGYGVRLDELEGWKGMKAQQLIRFLSRAEFDPHFTLDLSVDKDKNMAYAVGAISPSDLALSRPEGKGSGEMHRGQRDQRGSTTSRDSRGRDEAPRSSMRRDEREPSLRPRSFTFLHCRNDEEVGFHSHTNYKTREEVTLTYFLDYYEFYVQPEKDTIKLMDLQKRLYDDHIRVLEEQKCDLGHWKRGDVGCYFDNETRTAYRVTVLDVRMEEGKLRVQSADLGWRKTIDFREITPLLERYEGFCYCFPCTLEEFEPEDEEELINAKRSLIRLRNQKIIIEPQDKKPNNKLEVSFSFEMFNKEQRFPRDLYRMKHALPRRFD